MLESFFLRLMTVTSFILYFISCIQMLLLSQYISTLKKRRLHDNRQTTIYADLSEWIQMYSITLSKNLLQILWTTFCFLNNSQPSSRIIHAPELSVRCEKSHTTLHRNGCVLCMLQPMTNVRETDTQEADGAPAASQKANFQEHSTAW